MEKERQQQVNAYTDEGTDYTDDEDYNDEDHIPESEQAPKRHKRHTAEQIRELTAAYHQDDHPDEATRRAIGAKIGLDARQVKFWFQNQRTQMQAKALAEDTKALKNEHAALMAEKMRLRKAIETKSCIVCGGAMVPTHDELLAEKRRLLTENERLRGEIMRATLLNQIMLSAPPAERPLVNARDRRGMPSVGEGPSRADGVVVGVGGARLRALAESAMDQFLLLATKGVALCLPTPDGEVLSYKAYQQMKALPAVHHGLCTNDGFVTEATRGTGMVRADAAYLVAMLTEAKCWSEMFPGIVARVTSSSDVAIISNGVPGTRTQLINAGLHVQSPRLLNRKIRFLRYTKPVVASTNVSVPSKWAVMDVSVDGIIVPPAASRIANAAVAKNTVVPASYTGCRLLPSGCLVEDMLNGYCKITWVVHAEYNETRVPTIFRPFIRSGKAFGAHRWLAAMQRQCAYSNVLNSRLVPRVDNAATIPSIGKRGILKLVQRMMAVFYSAVSGPVTQPSSSIYEWPASTGTGARSIDAAVRMVTWKKAGSVDDLVLSASTTVWLPNTPPQLVFEYLCNGKLRAEWDIFAKGAAVREFCSMATSHLQGNVVSVLYSNVTDATNGKRVLILQQACTDESCSMVVYAPFEEDFMCGVMNGGDHTSVSPLPSGFAILPDGYGNARHAPSSSTAPTSCDNTPGSFLTMACQALLPGSSSSDNHAADRAFDDVGKLLCYALRKIAAAHKANMVVIPA